MTAPKEREFIRLSWTKFVKDKVHPRDGQICWCRCKDMPNVAAIYKHSFPNPWRLVSQEHFAAIGVTHYLELPK